MTPISDNPNQHPKPTGNLEELFRQKMAEAEVAPRADLWERLDNELLVRQNEGYRRRLGAWRWTAAAACAVATLSTGVWLTQQTRSDQSTAALPNLNAAAALRDTFAPAATPNHASEHSVLATAPAGVGHGQAAAEVGTAAASPAAPLAAPQSALAARSADAASGAAAAAAAPAAARSAQGAVAGRVSASRPAAASGTGGASAGLPPVAAGSGATALASAGRAGSAPTFTLISVASENTATSSSAASAAAASPDMLAWQPASLHHELPGGLPDSLKAFLLQAPELLAANDEPAAPEAETGATEKFWRLRGSYTASRYAPNVTASNFHTAAADLNNSFSYKTRGISTLDPGVAHRAQVGGSWQFAKHWSLQTGAEATLATGQTAVEDAKANNYVSGMPMVAFAPPPVRQARYRFISAGAPVQLRYSGQKTGWTIYAALGAAVNVLLHTRMDVDGETVADETPYRRLGAAARGGAGVQFAPASNLWRVQLGPEAEASLTTLNGNVGGPWLQRTRPCALGLTASVEFGGPKAEAITR